MSKAIGLLAIVVLALSAPASAGVSRLYVNADSTGGSGTSWADALPDLSEALAIAAAGTVDEIWVAQGIYKPGGMSPGRSDSFLISTNIALYGGFVGNEISLVERSVATNLTILSGDIGIQSDSQDNCYHVIRASGASADGARVDGFTIRQGSADGTSYPDDSGGGALIDDAAVTIANCTFTDNFGDAGGGAYVDGDGATFFDCVFQSNIAALEGGGIAFFGDGLVEGSSFLGNTGAFGGGVFACCGQVRIDGCRLSGNFAGDGGGVFAPSGDITVARSVFDSNSASDGGAMLNAASGTLMISCIVVNNTAQIGGGLQNQSTMDVVNSAFGKNRAFGQGGAAQNTGSLTFSNCTLYNNAAITFGGGVRNQALVTFENTILWRNSDAAGIIEAAQISNVGGIVDIDFCDVEGWTGLFGGIGNVPSDPLFVNLAGVDGQIGTADDDVTCAPNSPCVDAGDNGRAPSDEADLDDDSNVTEQLPFDVRGMPRFVDRPGAPDTGNGAAPIIDIGAAETSPNTCPGDISNDGFIDATDLAQLIGMWGAPGSADFNMDGVVNSDDLAILVGMWGPCPS